MTDQNREAPGGELSEAEKIVAGFNWYPWASDDFYDEYIKTGEKLDALPDDAPEFMKILAEGRKIASPEVIRASKIAKVPIEGGRYELSVICAPFCYSNGVDTYEAMVETISGDRVSGPEGHLDAAEVVAMLEKWKNR